MPTVQENEQKFEEMGLEQVRILIATDGLPHPLYADARRWVAQRTEREHQREAEERQRDREELQRDRQERQQDRARVIAYEAGMRRLTKHTLIAAWIAAVAAIIAIFF